MSPETNFAPRVGWTLPWILGGGGLGILLLVLTLLWMVMDHQATRGSIARLQGSIKELRDRVDSKEERESRLPDPERISRLRRETGEMEALLSLQGPPFLEVLLQLEKRIPDEVVLENLRHLREHGEVRVKARAEKYEQLTEFLGRLEGAPGFGEARLVRQSRRPEERGVAFEIRIYGGSG